MADALPRSTLIRDLQSGGWFKGVTEPKDSSFKAAVSLEMTVDGPVPVLTRPAPPPPVAVPGAASGVR